MKLNINDFLQILAGERIKNDHLVQAVQKLRTEAVLQGFSDLVLELLFFLVLASLAGSRRAVFFRLKTQFFHLADELRADVGSHNDDGVFEIDVPPLRVGQPPGVQNLEHHVENFRVRFFNLIKQNHGVRPVADYLRQLPAFLITHIARRRADEFGNGVALHVFGHIHADQGFFVVEQKLGQSARQLGLAHAGRPQKHERPDGLVLVGDARPRAADSVRDFFNRLVLPHHALFKLIPQTHELLRLFLQHSGDRNSGPERNHFRYVLRRNFLFQDAPRELQFFQPFFLGFQFLLILRNPGVANLGHAREIAPALRRFRLQTQSFQIFFQLPEIGDGLFLVFPLELQPLRSFFQIVNLPLNFSRLLLRRRVRLFFEGFFFNLKLHYFPAGAFQLRRQTVQIQAQSRGRFVHQIHRLVGQKAVGEVARRKTDRGLNGIVGDFHAVVKLVAGFQAAQNAHGVGNRGLVHKDRLETARQSGVAFNVFLIFLKRGGADHMEFSAGERGLEHIGSVNRALRSSRPHHRMQLVYENNDAPRGALNLAHHGFQALFKLAAIFRARDERAQIKRDKFFVFQNVRHVRARDSLRQPFGNRGFAHAGLADQHRVVLGAPRQDLHHPADFVFAPDDRIQLVVPGEAREISRVFFQNLQLELLADFGHAPSAFELREDPQNRFPLHAKTRENFLGLGIYLQNSQEKMLRGNIIVFEKIRGAVRLLQHPAKIRRQINLLGRHHDARRATAVERVQNGVGQKRQINFQLVQNGNDQSFVREHQSRQQMQGFNLVLPALHRELMRAADRFLGFGRKIMKGRHTT